jgi:hypothetical protein
MLTQFLPNLEEPSRTVMHSIPYQGVLLEKPPIQSWRRDEVIAWLQENRITYPQGLSKLNYYI